MTAVLVLGANGMLGSMVTDVLAGDNALDVTLTTRAGSSAVADAARPHLAFDATNDDVGALLARVPNVAWIVNAIGVIKPHINEADAHSRINALTINAEFPHRLAKAAEDRGARVVQIATDCVFSGLRGASTETTPHDPWDVYGKTKSLGEVPSPAMMHLRVSIIGPEQERHVSLLDWFRTLAPSATVTGFDNHLWNGVTTLQFAQIVRGVIGSDSFRAGTFHVVPDGVVTKSEMLQEFASAFDRSDVGITVAPATQALDRTLATNHPDVNEALWSDAGYRAIPRVGDMILELADHMAGRSQAT